MQEIVFDNGMVEVFSAHAHVYTTGGMPVVTYITARREWRPFAAEYDPVNLRQVLRITEEQAAQRAGATRSLIRQVEMAALAAEATAAAAHKASDAEGRRAWRALSQEERDAANRRSMETEGHPVD